ncbi:MAG TPA: hypothetical protein VFC73_02140 [Syntrophomonadaceae bacterium]|nr:hypothetical protein [Syntrophomonadaceae bacterium]
MIIGGAIGIIVGIIAVIGAIGAMALFGSEVWPLIVGAFMVLLSAVVSLIAGIYGVKYAAVPEKAQTCITYGILTAVFAVLGVVLNTIGGNSFSITPLITGLLLPGLYLFGAYQNKSLAQSTPQSLA